jgi:hypothetical protein
MLFLFSWFVWASGVGVLQFSLYWRILAELLRLSYADGGETDELGRHWKINIAMLFINSTLNELLDDFFPDWMWSRVVFNVVLELVVPGHCLF